MLVALALITALHAAEVTPESPERYLDALATAQALVRDGDDAAAAAALAWLLDQELPPEVAEQAAELSDTLAYTPPVVDMDTRPWLARARLTGWEAAMGATVGFGALWYPAVEGSAGAEILPVGMLVGGLVGGFSPRFWKTRFPLTTANTTALVGTQQLLMFNAAALSYTERNGGEAIPVALAVGALAGTVGGAALAEAGIGDGEVAAAHAGAFWGAGLAVAGLTVAYAWDDGSGITLPVLVLGADLGAVGGLALGHYAHLSREEVRMANVGAVFGAGAAYAFGWATEDSILWTNGGVAVLLSAGALLGGVGGALVVRVYDDRDPLARSSIELYPPMPSATPDGGPALALVNARF